MDEFGQDIFHLKLAVWHQRKKKTYAPTYPANRQRLFCISNLCNYNKLNQADILNLLYVATGPKAQRRNCSVCLDVEAALMSAKSIFFSLLLYYA